jgi:hypothetical protein
MKEEEKPKKKKTDEINYDALINANPEAPKFASVTKAVDNKAEKTKK